MKIAIVVKDDGDKDLFLDDGWIGTWGPGAGDMDILIPYALDKAVEIGEKKKQNEIKNVLGIFVNPNI